MPTVNKAAADSPDYFLDLSAQRPAVRMRAFTLGTARNPSGDEITADNLSLLRNGKPWLAVMGEIHYARVPAAQWRDELLKMKAGGIDVIASYVFWIHHEENRGEWNWSGERSLRAFVQTCADVGLPIIVRTGPWCHGEVRNGGFPDWLLKEDLKTRSDDPPYLDVVRELYAQIAGQLAGLLWKDGGPVIGIQLENEFSGPGSHLLSLKRIAREAGLDVPLYTRTGWPNLQSPIDFGEILPLFGAYAEGFWDRELTPMPGKYWHAFNFESVRTDAAVGTDQLGAREAHDEADAARYPYLTCELGGGMMAAYHRRIKIDPRDIAAVLITKLGSGSNLPGYYMYHGGSNPDGKLTTLQESQATGYWNDLPVKSYDFQAPVGALGQIRPHYHLLRRVHLFLHDFGAALSSMPAVFPSLRPSGKTDSTTLRWVVRTDGNAGFVFVNNYQRFQPMPAKPAVRFNLKLATEELKFPSEPIEVPADSSFFWPFNLDLGGATLVYATAQPVCRVIDGDTTCIFFTETRGVATEFAFAGATRIDFCRGDRSEADGRITLKNFAPGLEPAVSITTAVGKKLVIVLLDDESSLTIWKGNIGEREHVFLTAAGLTIDGSRIKLLASDASAGDGHCDLLVFPRTDELLAGSTKLVETPSGIFTRYAVDLPPSRSFSPKIEAFATASAAREIHHGSQGVAEAPTDIDFEQSAVWRVTLPPDLAPLENVRLLIRYVGDVARVYAGTQLLADDFYNGNSFEVGLDRIAGVQLADFADRTLDIAILPLRKDAPIYLAEEALPEFVDGRVALVLRSVEVICEKYLKIEIH